MLTVDHKLALSETYGTPEGPPDHKGVPATPLDLLRILTEVGVPRISALKTQIGLAAQSLGKSPIDLTLDELHDIKPRYRALLEKRRLSENSVQAYVFELKRLLDFAMELGWSPGSDVPRNWTSVFEQSKSENCLKVCRYVMRLRPEPHLVTQDDINAWIIERMQSVAWDTARKEAGRFKQLLARSGAWSQLGPLYKEGYGVPLRELPLSLQQEIKAVLAWKTAPVARGRQKGEKTREITTGNTRDAICLLFGYARSAKQLKPLSLRDLVTPDVLYDFVSWSLDRRGLAGYTVHLRLAQILALFRQHADYEDVDVQWMQELVDDIPLESEEERQEKRAAKQVPYTYLEKNLITGPHLQAGGGET